MAVCQKFASRESGIKGMLSGGAAELQSFPCM